MEGESDNSTETEDTLSGSEDEEEGDLSAFVMQRQKAKKQRNYVTIGVVGHPVCVYACVCV